MSTFKFKKRDEVLKGRLWRQYVKVDGLEIKIPWGRLVSVEWPSPLAPKTTTTILDRFDSRPSTLGLAQILDTCSCPHSSVRLWQKWGSCSSKFVWPRIWRPNPWIIKKAKNTMNKWWVNQKTSKNDLLIGLEWFSFKFSMLIGQPIKCVRKPASAALVTMRKRDNVIIIPDHPPNNFFWVFNHKSQMSHS